MRYFLFSAPVFLVVGIYLLQPMKLTPGWVNHQCPAGKKDYQPGHGGGQSKTTEGYDFSFTIGEGDWYDPTLLGREAKDWLKAGGVSYFSIWRPRTYLKNHLSALVGFRMGAEKTFEVCAYVNDLTGGHRTDGIQKIPLGDTVHVQYRLVDQRAVFQIEHREKMIESVFKDFASAGRQVAVGPWHGGSLPAPVATGLGAKLRWVE